MPFLWDGFLDDPKFVGMGFSLFVEDAEFEMFSYDVYLVYEAIEDGNESNMFNANYKKALEWFPYDCENFIIFPPSPPDPND